MPMSPAGAAPSIVPAGFAGGFPSRGSLPHKVTRLLVDYQSALSLFTTSLPNPGPQDVPTAAHSLGCRGKHREQFICTSATKGVPRLRQQALSFLFYCHRVLTLCCCFLKARLLKPVIKAITAWVCCG